MDPDVAELLGEARKPPPNRRREIAEFYEPGMSEREMVQRQKRLRAATYPPPVADVIRAALLGVYEPIWYWAPLPGCDCLLCRRTPEPTPMRFPASSA